ncbi:hypothetical protein [Dactylosporangium fulvum]|uniref:Cytotoxic translational repressor of toxin-antitoxin stability system n=1 Tax=Dactylosporangium fulvum TaxID=53359 RepID=A0ABY5W2N2_9ACTN|nr:hypothetical protein [Dactylosporangium fulvum]UWP84258.1 hypothetical protein Dfulv_08470 [Dactylosporangium fulvum]
MRDARGRTGTHHVTYELVLKDGTVLRTRISHPPDRSTYGAGLWTHILRDQLRVSETEFWACVRGGEHPDRGEVEQPRDSLPADLVHLLITRVGLEQSVIAAMSREDAVERLQRFWTEGA